MASDRKIMNLIQVSPVRFFKIMVFPAGRFHDRFMTCYFYKRGIQAGSQDAGERSALHTAIRLFSMANSLK